MKGKKIKFSLILIALLLLLTACGGSSDFKANTPDDTLVVANGAEPVTFDIQATNDQATTRVARQIYQTLIRQNEDLTLSPELATEWKDVGNNTWEFKLRDDVTFHNGEKFTAKDVEWTIKRAAQSATISHLVGTVDPDKIKVIDDYTIQIGTKEAFGPFLTHLAHPATAIMNEKAVTEGGEDYGTKYAVGTGPYKFVEWVSGSSLKLEKFDDYWGDAPKLAKVEFKFIKEASVRLVELETGAVDIAFDIAPADVSKVKENADLQLVAESNLGAEYIGFNVKNDTPLQNKLVRQALAYAIDVEAIIKSVHQGVGKQMAGPINELVFAYNPDLKPYEFDLDKAKSLLAEAGYADGGFTLKLYVGDNNQERIKVAQIFKEQASKIGITVEITQLDWATFLDAAAKGEPDVFLLGWTTVTTDADYGLFPLFHTSMFGSAGNRTFYSNPEVDRLLELGRYTSDQEKRKEYYYEAQEIIHDDAPWVFMQTRENVTGLTKFVQGFVDHPTGSYFLEGISK